MARRRPRECRFKQWIWAGGGREKADLDEWSGGRDKADLHKGMEP